MKKISKTIIIGNDSRKSATSSVSRGIVGGLLFGGLGALGGALSAKNKNKTTFLIVYENGKRETKEVKNNSPDYNKFINYLEI